LKFIYLILCGSSKNVKNLRQILLFICNLRVVLVLELKPYMHKFLCFHYWAQDCTYICISEPKAQPIPPRLDWTSNQGKIGQDFPFNADLQHKVCDNRVKSHFTK